MKTTNFRRLLALLLALILLGSAVVYADEGAAAPAEEPAEEPGEEPAVELQLPEEWTEEEALGEEPVVLFEGPDELAEPELLPEEDPRFAAFAEDPEALPVLNEATRSPIPETPADEPVPIGGTPDFSKMTEQLGAPGADLCRAHGPDERPRRRHPQPHGQHHPGRGRHDADARSAHHPQGGPEQL